jgi:putative membrane protein
MNRFNLLAAAGLVIAAPLAAAPTTHAPDFVKQAGASDLYEKTSSQMVLKTAKGAKVRSFAQMMITDHNKSTMQVKAAAKSDHVVAGPPKLMPAQAKMISELKAAKGANMEKLYVTQQLTAHEQALALHTTFAQGGDKPALKQAAAGIVPVVQSHLDELRGMQGR